MDGYGDNEDKKWKVESDCDTVRIISRMFDTETDYDKLYIAGDTNSLIFSGDDDYPDEKVVIDHLFPGDINLNFVSDGENSSPYKGFELYWECRPLIILSGTNGTIHMDGYGDEEYKRWKVESDCDTVRITSRMFDTESNYDKLYIAGDTNSHIFSGDDVIDHLLSEDINLNFVADYATSSSYKGFELYWECLKILSEWQEWQSCSATCDEGTQLRARTCTQGTCVGDLNESKGCTIEVCVIRTLSSLVCDKFDFAEVRNRICRRFTRLAKTVNRSFGCPSAQTDLVGTKSKLDELWAVQSFDDLDAPMQELIALRFTPITGTFRSKCTKRMNFQLNRWAHITMNILNDPL